MKRLVLITLVLVGAAYQGWGRLEPHLYRYVPYEKDTEIVMYGRKGCSSCDLLTGRLAKEGIPYVWKDVDADRRVNDEMWYLIWDAGYENKRSVMMPVVQIGEAVFIAPPFETVAELYGEKRFVMPSW